MVSIALPPQPHSWLDRLRTIQLGIGARGAVGLGLARQRAGAAAAPCYYLSFDGTDYGTLALQFTPPVTIVFWIKPTNTTQHWLLSESAYSYSWQKWTVNLVVHGGTSYGGTVSAGVWQHFAATIPGNGSQIRVFISGTDVTSVTGNSNGATATYTQLGRRFGGTGYYTGLMAAVGMAPSVLSVATMYAAGTFHKPLNPATFSLLALNMRNEAGSGTTVDDESANDKNVTLAAAPNTPAWGGTMATGGPAGWSDI